MDRGRESWGITVVGDWDLFPSPRDELVSAMYGA